MKKTKRKEGQLDEGTKQWMERRPELVKRLKEMGRICENEGSEHELLAQADAAGRELVGSRLEKREEQEHQKARTNRRMRRRSRRGLRLLPAAERRCRLQSPFPEKLEMFLGDQIYLAKETLPAPLRNRLLRLAASQNPEFYCAQAMRLSTYGKPSVVFAIYVDIIKRTGHK